jgi:hypothetical protein
MPAKANSEIGVENRHSPTISECEDSGPHPENVKSGLTGILPESYQLLLMG